MSQTNDAVVFNYYDYNKGWEQTNPGWHEIEVLSGPLKHTEMVSWLYDHVDGTERHTRWIRFAESSGFKFRYERDYIMFTLRWS